MPVVAAYGTLAYRLAFQELMKKQKNKKVYSSRCDLGASIECELLNEHSMHSDYWHETVINSV